jgi:triphosphatase
MKDVPVSAHELAHQAKEIELKLEFDPADAPRIVSHPALKASLTPPEERDLISVYFDTADFALRKAGVYLRVRDTGTHYIQTIKSLKSEAAPMERDEWEREILSARPELVAAEGTALAPLLTPQVRASLRPLFETRIRRKSYLVGSGDSKIEVAIDEGEVVSGERRRPILELELELKQGETNELFRLARTLAETLPLRLAVKTKAERGYELLEPGTRDVEKAAELDIKPTMASGEAFRAIAESCLRQIVVNEPAMCRGHAEALHQMRIGLRRLRAAITIFDDVVADEDQEKIKAELKWITQELGPARDLDVLAADVLKPLLKAHPGDETIAATHRDVAKKREAAYARAAGSARSARFRNAMLDLVEWVETGPWSSAEDADCMTRRTRPIAEHARKKLARLRKRVKKGADLRHQSVGQRHKLRIRAKRLRYATEFFAGTFEGDVSAKRTAEALSALKDLQDALGGLNDIATRHTLIVEGGEVRQAMPHRGVAESGNQAETLLHKAEQALDRFARAKAFWKN